MGLVNFLKRIFCEDTTAKTDEICDVPEESELSEFESKEEKQDQFTSENIIFDKLLYLEQYIKIFSLTFQKEYNEYLLTIQELKKSYSEELERFEDAKKGNITFSVDPEEESKRYVEVLALEQEIKTFVDFEVEYKHCVDRFSKLSYKLNVFYNAIIDTTVSSEQIARQIANAYDSLEVLVNELNQKEFFKKDSRKKDNVLNYIIYCDYIIFKAYIRINKVTGFDEYKQEMSGIYSKFSNSYYEKLVFKFFVESIEEMQLLIKENLDKDNMFEYTLKQSQVLERRLNSYVECFKQSSFFEDVIKLENTVHSLTNVHCIKFFFDISKVITFASNTKGVISINNIAKTLLGLLGSKKALLLQRIISGFKVEISWREFYFLCKIFDVTSDVISVASNTVFNMVETKFTKLTEKYQEYTDEYIGTEKKKILYYSGSKSKKYIVLFKISQSEELEIINILKTLCLDFVIKNSIVYLNYSYFNGFKNLQVNFGQVITF